MARLSHRISLCLSWVAAALLTAGPVQAQVAGSLGVAPPASAMTPVERVRGALAQAGITVCAPMIERAAAFLFENGQGNFTIQPLAPDVNRWPVVLTIKSQHPGNGTTRLTIVTIAPAGSCSGSYEQVITWQQNCDTLKSTVFSAFSAEKYLYRTVRQSEMSAGVQLYLMPVGTSGCVSVKKELLG